MKTLNIYKLLTFLVLPFLLSWPAWFNGQPFLFQDTTAYIKGAASATNLLVETKTARNWLTAGMTPADDARAAAAAAGGAPAPAPSAQLSSSPDKSGVISGRSIYYGMFMFLTACVLGLKGVPLLQALLATAMIATFLRQRYTIDYRTIAAALLLLAVASPLPYFNSMLMPDVFAGLGIAGVVALVMMPRAPTGVRLFWALLTVAAVLFHTANIMIILATIITLVVVWLVLNRREPIRWTAVALAVGLVFAGVAGEAAFNFGVRHFTNTSPIRPPFMTARLLADGPGNTFVQTQCPQAGFEVCKYARDFTRATSDDFLWSADPRIGVFTLASKDARTRLGQQDFAFAKAVFTAYPLQVMENSARNIGAQLGYIGLEEFVYAPGMVQNFEPKIPADEQAVLESTRAATGTFDVSYSALLIQITSVAALLVCLAAVVVLFRRRQYPELTLISIMLLSMVINAGVCGALSTPHDRYQGRIIWILQLMAIVIVAVRYNRVKLPAAQAGRAEEAPAQPLSAAAG